MAAQLRNSDFGGSEYDAPPMNEINVTPFVDVMLVLLIVFMVAAPLMTVGVPVNLPQSQSKPLIDQIPPISVSLDAGGKIFLDKTEIKSADLINDLKTQTQGDTNRRIHVRGDKTLPYGQIMDVMGLINQAGFAKVALVSELPSGR